VGNHFDRTWIGDDAAAPSEQRQSGDREDEMGSRHRMDLDSR
jgi:hypothetical protein